MPQCTETYIHVYVEDVDVLLFVLKMADSSMINKPGRYPVGCQGTAAEAQRMNGVY